MVVPFGLRTEEKHAICHKKQGVLDVNEYLEEVKRTVGKNAKHLPCKNESLVRNHLIREADKKVKVRNFF